MLRPATPLSILLLCSFVLLLISVISTPIIRGIPIARFQKYNFGVFGYCLDDSPCSGVKIGYTTDGLFPDDEQLDFNLPQSARHSLSSLLIVHPVAALCNFIVLILAVVAHFHSPSHSARYLLALLISLLPTLLITLLAFLVDILLFVPYVQWGGWIVLASTILITASGVVTCAMRRTLVSRKARKRRIAENAEMSGENFYNRQEQDAKMAAVSSINTESKVPLVNGSPGADTLPSFTTYDSPRRYGDRQQISQPTHSDSMTLVSPVNEDSRYYATSSRLNGRPIGEPGIPLAPINTRTPDGLYRPSPDGRGPGPLPPNGYGMRGGYGPPRGRGGYPPRGGFAPRGGFGPRGPPPPQGYGRGGFNPDMRGGYSGRGRGGFSGASMAVGAMGGAMMADTASGRGLPPPGYPPQNEDVSPEGYGPRQDFPTGSSQNASAYAPADPSNYEPVSPSQYTAMDENTTSYVAYSRPGTASGKEPSVHSRGPSSIHSRGPSPAGRRRTPSPPPDMPLIGQAVEMNATNGRMAGYDSNAYNAVNMPQGRSLTMDSQEEQRQQYIPPRTQWNNSPEHDSAPAHHAVTVEGKTSNRPRGTSNASGSYYEDVDPRFAEAADSVPALPQRSINVHQQQSLLHPSYNGQDSRPDTGHSNLPHTASYEDLPVGARSPAESETSHFTSVSQRGVNPNWRPGHGGEFNNLGPRRPQQARQDMILANNPDFELVPPPARFGGRGGRGAFRGAPMGGGPMGRMPPPSALGMNGDSPYPGPTTMREI